MIELPKDAEGRDIPLDTKVLYDYDGSKQNVEVFIFSRKDAEWSVETDFAIYDAEELYLTPPDSWEKLEEDLTAFDDGQIYGPCHYFHELGDDCTSCVARDDACADAVMRDVASRIRKLRGED